MGIGNLSSCTFCNVNNLVKLDLSNNLIKSLSYDKFQGLPRLNTLFLNGNAIDVIPLDTFTNLKRLKHAYFDKKIHCCHLPSHVECSGKHEYASGFFSCHSLLPSRALLYLIFIFAAIILIFNIIVIFFWSKKIVNKEGSIQTVGNIFLALANVLTGMYLVIIGIADISYRGISALYMLPWKTSFPCQAAAIILFVSVQMSVSVLLLLSMCRIHSFLFPFRKRLVTKKSLVIIYLVLIMSWGFTGFFLYRSSNLVNNVCFIFEVPSLDQEDGSFSALVTFTLMIGNILSLFVTLVLNVWSIRIVKQSTHNLSQHSKAIKTTKLLMMKTLITSMSEFVSWSIILPVALLSITGVSVDATVISWIAVFGFPLNAMMNPILHTFTTSAFCKSLTNMLPCRPTV